MRTEAFTRRRDRGQKSNGEAEWGRRRSWSPPKPSSHPGVPPSCFFSFLPTGLGGCDVRGQISLSWVCEVSQDHQRLPLLCRHLTRAGQQGLRNDGLNDQERGKVGVLRPHRLLCHLQSGAESVRTQSGSCREKTCCFTEHAILYCVMYLG